MVHGAWVFGGFSVVVPVGAAVLTGAPGLADAQPGAQAEAITEFVRVIGGPTVDRGVGVTATRDGGFAAVGYTTVSGQEEVYLVRCSDVGGVLWTQTYGGGSHENGWSVCETEDGFAIAGFTRSFGSGGWDFYLIRTDGAGELLWSRTYGGVGDDRCWSVARTDDGGFILAGETDGSGAGERDFLLVRTDAGGEEVWSRTIGGAADDRCFAVVGAGDGGFMLAGQTFSEGAGDRDAYIVKTDAGGGVEWSRTFGGTQSDVAHDVRRTAGGAFLVTGYTTSFAVEGDDPYLIKIRPDGETVWTRVVQTPGVVHTITGDEISGGGLCCVGFSEWPRGQNRKAVLLRLSADGELEELRDVMGEGYVESMAYTVRAIPGGGCVASGHATRGRDTDLVLVKVAE